MMWHPGYGARETAKWVAWIVGGAWVWRAGEMRQRIGEVADLTSLDWMLGPAQSPKLAVIIPAKDEGENLRATLDSLAGQEYPWVRAIVVDDRSLDETSAIADEYAERFAGHVAAMHIDELPEGWMGKTWALEVGTQLGRDADYLLFTDADVQFSPAVLGRALAYAEISQADHLVVFPTPLVRKWTEGVVLGFFQVLAMWAARPWRVADVKARRDVAGVGAFNLVRREAFEEIGGWGPQSLVVLEDVTLGRRMKAAGMRSRVAFAPGMVLVHWAAGMRGIVGVMTKNLFSTVNFRPLLMLLACLWIVVFCLAPLAGLAWVGTLVPCALMLFALGWCYRELKVMTGIDPRFGFGYPLGAVALMWAMLRSMGSVMLRRGVLWRGTFYPLKELRAHNDPFKWEREAAELRDRERKVAPSRLRRWVDARKRKPR